MTTTAESLRRHEVRARKAVLTTASVTKARTYLASA